MPNIIFVMKWLKTRHATMFRLSNNMIQAIFLDGSELMFNSITKLLTYVSKIGERINCTMSEAANGENIELNQRFAYVIEVLNVSKGFRYKTKEEEEALREYHSELT